MRQLLTLLILFSVSLFSFTSLASDPSIEWKVLKSPHFEVIYDKNYRDQALVFLNAAETSYKALSQVFSEMQETTTIFITDQTDQSNGFASYLPYPYIVIYPVMPDSLSELSSYDDWALELVMHEYTHILSMKPSNGIYIPLKWIFGSVVRPNAILPRWYLEGIAVEMESRFTLHGRLRSPQTSAALRAFVEAETLGEESIDRINESGIPSYPYGGRPYLFGSLLWKHLTDEKDVSIVDQLHQRYSRRLPFLLNGPLEDLLGFDYKTALDSMYAKVRTLAEVQLKNIRSSAQDKGRPSEFKGLNQHSPSISPDGKKMLFFSAQPYEGGHLWLAEKTGSQKSFQKVLPQALIKIKGSTQATWLPDSKTFIFDQIDTWDRYYYFRDLYQYSLEDKEVERLTHGERASDPILSPNGELLAYIKTDGGRTELRVLDLKTKSSRTIFAPALFVRLSRPAFLDGDKLIVSIRSRQGHQGLYEISLDQNQRAVPQPILENFPEAGQARMTSRGLLFTSSLSGTSNVYLASKDLSQAKALSNTTTTLLNADLDPHSLELWTSRLTSKGPKLFVTQKVQYLKPAQIEPLVGIPNGWNQTHLEAENIEVEDASYWSTKYLLPRYWIPFIYPVEGGLLFQGSTATQDPAGINAYALQWGFDSVTEKWSYGASFVNRSLPVGISLTASEYQDYLGSTDSTLTQRYQSLGFDHYLPGLSEKFRGNLFGTNTETEVPQSGSTRKILRHGAGLGFSYADFGQSIGDSLYSDGNSADIQYIHFFEGPKLTAYEKYELNLAHRLKSFFPSRHALLTQLKGSHAPLIDIRSELIPLGDKTVGANYLASLINSSHLMRGYPSGAFVGRSLVNLNVEYSFPLIDIFKGPGLFPWFFNGIETAVFTDGVAVDGAFYDLNVLEYRRSKIEDSFWSSGLEFRLSTTAAYHLPLDITLGLYYGYDTKAGGEFTTFVGLGYTPHEGIGKTQLK